MAFPPAAPQRQLKHRRSIDLSVYARDDGLWEIDARLVDVKTRDMSLATGTRKAGEPLHDMVLRLVIDTQLNIVEAGASTTGMPYPGHCDQHGDAYARLVGLNLFRNFRRSVKERLGGIAGCTHLTEMATILPTAVIQAFAGEVFDVRESGGDAADQQAPFQLDRCHALRSDGEAVRLFYPRWYRPHEGQSGLLQPTSVEPS
ncbi:DUF2889 domain-containing protein [Aquabacterium sp. A7-Y]|uniref:DUF2889 domain-containing protein n=1 Tax=Aquabacterium sp. A7-Y TaxID=1349605 RepID=UPI00223D07C9|nr:DUF2889 domain-containing protein [Aquabacterium sp. A7-Y]MCW7538962.1 DUF2889 domain-containing protein [Aquabacterium sp. A7-Y]